MTTWYDKKVKYVDAEISWRSVFNIFILFYVTTFFVFLFGVKLLCLVLVTQIVLLLFFVYGKKVKYASRLNFNMHYSFWIVCMLIIMNVDVPYLEVNMIKSRVVFTLITAVLSLVPFLLYAGVIFLVYKRNGLIKLWTVKFMIASLFMSVYWWCIFDISSQQVGLVYLIIKTMLCFVSLNMVLFLFRFVYSEVE